jgi:hypothetical protein
MARPDVGKGVALGGQGEMLLLSAVKCPTPAPFALLWGVPAGRSTRAFRR